MDFQLRDIYTKKRVIGLAKRIKKVYSAFDDKAFCRAINSKLESLNFGPRSNLIRDNLHKYLPASFPKAANILITALGPDLVLETGKTDWGAFMVMPQTEFIAKYGLDHYDVSMNALYEMTKRLSSENGIRPFIRKYPKKTLSILKKWTKDKSVHVRRLVSEGTRPRLPLASQIRIFIQDPKPMIVLLDLLKDDDDLYVRRSVANNLNDISKDNPDIVVAVLTKWYVNAPPNRIWVIKHALRTLFKRGHKGALALLGYEKPSISIERFEIKTMVVKQGDHLEFTLGVNSKKDQELMIDYAIHFVKANGKHADKVFKLAKKKMKKGDSMVFNKRHSFKTMTTRKHYAGKHILEIIVNGDRYNTKEFILKL